jgi:hypothetical protein
VILTYKTNRTGTVQAAYSGIVRVVYVDQSNEGRWLWSLNTIQPKGGRASGIEATEVLAKDKLEYQWVLWLTAAGLQMVEAMNDRPVDGPAEGNREAVDQRHEQ